MAAWQVFAGALLVFILSVASSTGARLGEPDMQTTPGIDLTFPTYHQDADLQAAWVPIPRVVA